MAERDRLQPGESVGTVGAAQEDRQLDAHQLAAATCKDRRSIAQARSLLLAAVGRVPSYAATVWKHVTAD